MNFVISFSLLSKFSPEEAVLFAYITSGHSQRSLSDIKRLLGIGPRLSRKTFAGLIRKGYLSGAGKRPEEISLGDLGRQSVSVLPMCSVNDFAFLNRNLLGVNKRSGAKNVARMMLLYMSARHAFRVSEMAEVIRVNRSTVQTNLKFLILSGIISLTESGHGKYATIHSEDLRPMNERVSHFLSGIGKKIVL